MVRVIRIIDGDTIEIEGGERVRYIGINTPETVECFGLEATDRNEALVEGRIVGLERDVSEIDSFGRLLRYVYVDGVMVNELLVRKGYAKVSTFLPDVKYEDRFLAAEQEARYAGLGLWSACQGPADNCDTFTSQAVRDWCRSPAGNVINCPHFPTKTEATRFTQTVDTTDINGLDNDKDGTSCENLPA